MEIKIEEKEKRALENVKSLLLYSSEHEYFSPFKEEEIDDMNIVLNLVSTLIAENKELKEENEGLKTKLDTLIEKYKELKEEKEELKRENLEIRDWKYVIDSPVDLDKLKELDLIKIKGKEYVSKDKIKARLEELKEYLYKGNIKDDFLMIRIKAKIQELQSLLEKE